MGERESIIDYRGMYEQSVCMLLYNIVRDITTQLEVTNPIKFKKKNRCKFNGEDIVEIFQNKNGDVVVKTDKTTFKINEFDKIFIEFTKDPYNFINLYESVVKEIKE